MKQILRDLAFKKLLYFRPEFGGQSRQFRASYVTFHNDGSVTILRNGEKQRFTEGVFYTMSRDVAALPIN